MHEEGKDKMQETLELVMKNNFKETGNAILPLHWESCQTFFSSKYRHACMFESEQDLMLHFCQH